MPNESAAIRAASRKYVPTQAERKYGKGHVNKMATTTYRRPVKEPKKS